MGVPRDRNSGRARLLPGAAGKVVRPGRCRAPFSLRRSQGPGGGERGRGSPGADPGTLYLEFPGRGREKEARGWPRKPHSPLFKTHLAPREAELEKSPICQMQDQEQPRAPALATGRRGLSGGGTSRRVIRAGGGRGRNCRARRGGGAGGRSRVGVCVAGRPVRSAHAAQPVGRGVGEERSFQNGSLDARRIRKGRREASRDISVARLMGKQGYEYCPTSPEDPGEEMMWGAYRPRSKPASCYAAAMMVLVVLSGVFFALYLVQKYSTQARQRQACQLQDQAQVSFLQKLLNETREDASTLSQQLEAVNESLAQTQKKWHSCQSQLNTLQENITSWEAEKHTWNEIIQDLKQQLAKKTLELDEFQKERKRHQAETETGQPGRTQEQGSNGGNFFGGPSLVLFTITLAGSLSV